MAPLSRFEKQLIIGSHLGDGAFDPRCKGRYTFCQGQKQHEYLMWKYNNFSQNHRCNIHEEKHHLNDKELIVYSFAVNNKFGDFDDLYRFIKEKGTTIGRRKAISYELLNELDELGLAIWWMDDGSLSVHNGNRWGKLCTHTFTFEEHIIMQRFLKERFDLNFQIRKEKDKYYFFRFGAKEAKKLFSIIYKYVCQIPSMIYKIDMNYDNEKWIGEDYQPIYNFIKNSKICCKDGTLETAGVA